ncbi:MAG: hypothetical protein KDA96_04555 [Planctomycetaceae bacterium]|nr:hypothetical protein [Planctomycetaceae bacterium]
MPQARTILTVSMLLSLAFVHSSGQSLNADDAANTVPHVRISDDDFRAAYESRVRTGQLKRGHFPMRSDGPKSLDPIRGSTVYENQCITQVYETLLQYKYFKRPFELEPLLLEEMPQSDDGVTWRFRLRDDIYFHDDPCFPNGVGRRLVAADVFYSWKRLADNDNQPKSWWLLEKTIAGLDEYREEQNASAVFDYDKPVEGLRILNDREFEVVLRKPMTRFLWTLAMFQLSVVPREAVEYYGSGFVRHPVGTGPYLVRDGDWRVGVSITFNRNPRYREQYFPAEWMPEDEADGLTGGAGQRLPILDEIQVTFYTQDQPMWLMFLSRANDFCQVPAENYTEAFNPRSGQLRRFLASQGVKGYPVPLLDFIFKGFNMEDELLGGYSEEKKALRQAICLAQDWDEVNQTFYNGLNIVYDGVIPPDLAGHPPGHHFDRAYRGPDIERARALLAKAGYPDGKGLPMIDYYISRTANNEEQVEMLKRQLGRINVKLRIHIVDFSALMQAVDRRQAPYFSFALGSDYPDGENNLALFYGPNESPGSNHFNYKRAEYDTMYEQIVSMQPSPERDAKYIEMQEMIMEDCPISGSMARTRFYVVHPRMKYFKPVETFENWYKYIDIVR